MKIVMSKTIQATPPGWTLREQLEMRKMTQKEFALRMDMSEKHISKLINGEVRLTPEVAYRIESILGVPAYFWNNLEAYYRERLIKAQEENEMDADIEISKQIPYSEIAKLGWIKLTSKATEKVINLRRFFEVARLSVIKNLERPVIAYRKLGENDKSFYVLATWIQKARLTARKMKVSAVNLQKLSESVSSIRQLTTEAPEVFCKRLIEILSECGIALVFLPHLKGSFLHGASFIDCEKIIIALTVRGNYADKFWFSLFHEIGHILKGHISKREELSSKDEENADDFAKNILIPPKEYKNFISAGNFTHDAVKEFAEKIKIDAGILVGRLQKEAKIKFNQLNELRKSYQID